MARRGTRRQQKSRKNGKIDGGLNWKDCNNDYSNPNIEVPFDERSGPSRVVTAEKPPFDFFQIAFLACKCWK